jgi:protein involved in polysaccharide export with SLBB domain
MIRIVSIMLVLLSAACASVASPPVDASAPFVYRLGTGDRLRITVFDEPRLSGEFALDGTGSISYPLLGSIVVAAKTTAEVQAQITERLSTEFVRNPKVSVDVINYRSVYVLGEVARPGEFAYSEGLTALALVAKAGGFTYRANQRVVFIHREKSAAEATYPLDAKLLIRPGDTVRVGERYF